MSRFQAYFFKIIDKKIAIFAIVKYTIFDRNFKSPGESLQYDKF